MTVSQALKEATSMLSGSVNRPRLEAEILLSHCLGCDRSMLLLRDRDYLPNSNIFFEMINQRLENRPIEYITQSVSFYSHNFFVNSNVLIPRPETEILVQKAVEYIQKYNLKNIIEVGVGSGVISIMVALLVPDIKITATDISKEALNVAKINIDRYNLTDKITLIHTSMLEGIAESFDILLSNPPYIPQDTKLESNIIDYEPHTALFCEGDGTKMLKDLVVTAQDRGIQIAGCEMGYDQKESMERFFIQKGITNYKFYKDYASLDRGFFVEF